MIDLYGDNADDLAVLRGVAPKNAQGYWYEADIYYCPICCSESKYRQRVTDRPRPRKWADRNHIIEAWDYCDAL